MHQLGDINLCVSLSLQLGTVVQVDDHTFRLTRLLFPEDKVIYVSLRWRELGDTPECTTENVFDERWRVLHHTSPGQIPPDRANQDVIDAHISVHDPSLKQGTMHYAHCEPSVLTLCEEHVPSRVS